MAHENKTTAMPRVIAVGLIEPFSANKAMDSPAPKKRYQRGPPMMTPIGKMAAKKTKGTGNQ